MVSFATPVATRFRSSLSTKQTRNMVSCNGKGKPASTLSTVFRLDASCALCQTMPVRLRRSTKATFSCRLQATRFSVSVSAAGSLARRIGATGERMGVSAYGRIGVWAYRRMGVWEKRIGVSLDIWRREKAYCGTGRSGAARVYPSVQRIRLVRSHLRGDRERWVNSRAGQLGVLTLQILSLRPPTPAHTPIRPSPIRRYVPPSRRYVAPLRQRLVEQKRQILGGLFAFQLSGRLQGLPVH
jgi:hypothetical protein